MGLKDQAREAWLFFLGTLRYTASLAVTILVFASAAYVHQKFREHPPAEGESESAAEVENEKGSRGLASLRGAGFAGRERSPAGEGEREDSGMANQLRAGAAALDAASNAASDAANELASSEAADSLEGRGLAPFFDTLRDAGVTDASPASSDAAAEAGSAGGGGGLSTSTSTSTAASSSTLVWDSGSWDSGVWAP